MARLNKQLAGILLGLCVKAFSRDGRHSWLTGGLMWLLLLLFIVSGVSKLIPGTLQPKPQICS